MLMISCHVSRVPSKKNGAAQSTTHTTKNHPCEVH